MVGHSIGGIYVRKYAALYPTEVAGLVLLDSAHEEQFARVSQISPEWAQRIHGRFPADEQCAQGFLPGNERLAWRFNGPLVVIEHGRISPSAASDHDAEQSEVVFHLLQRTWLADRNTGSFARRRRAATTFSAMNQNSLPSRSRTSFERA
jgi:pimeloyl-ACP methyl ester carboxylesterase